MRKNSLFVIALILIVASLAACDGSAGAHFGSGKVVDHEVEATGFTKVEAGGAFQIEIRQSESYNVVIRVDDNLVEGLDVYVSGGTLHIGFRSGFWVTNATRMEAEITMPELTGVDLSGASRGTITGFKSTKDFSADVSGASSLTGDLESGDVSLNVSGASSVDLAGSGGDLTAESSGASHIDLEDFPVQDASVEVSGASSATVAPSGRIDVEASGASHLYYLGSPTLGTVNTSGGSSIERK